MVFLSKFQPKIKVIIFLPCNMDGCKKRPLLMIKIFERLHAVCSVNWKSEVDDESGWNEFIIASNYLFISYLKGIVLKNTTKLMHKS